MADIQPGNPLPPERRQEIFRALIEAQDTGLDVPASRKAVAERYCVSVGDIRQIEREGLDHEWPPL
jgi:hypothetical protein